MTSLKLKKHRKYADIHTILYFMVSVPFLALFVILGLMCYLTIRPFSQQLYVKLMAYLQSASIRNKLYLYEFWSTFDMSLYIEKDVYENFLGKESAICIPNHICVIDFMYAQIIMASVNKLQILNYFIKANSVFIPLYGQVLCILNHIFINKSFGKDGGKITRHMEKLAASQELFVVLLYAEGTRFTEEKREASVEFARERGLKLYKHHLIPRTKGFSTIVPIIKNKIRAIYDLEMLEGGRTSISNLFAGVHHDIHIYLRRIPIVEVHTSTTSLDHFLYDMYTRKDEMMETFRNSREKFAESYLNNFIVVPIKPNRKTLWQIIVQAIIILPIYFYYLFHCVYVGDAIGVIMCFAYVGIGVILQIVLNYV